MSRLRTGLVVFVLALAGCGPLFPLPGVVGAGGTPSSGTTSGLMFGPDSTGAAAPVTSATLR